MTNPVDHSEWIDRYLRGELRGEELDVFERKLQQDPQFALEFNSHKLLADAIRAARKEELKRFIAERTRHRVITLPRNRSFLIGLAASIAIFAAGWLGWKSVLPKMQKQEVAANKEQKSGNTADNAPSPDAPQQEKEPQDHTLAYQKQEAVEAIPTPETADEHLALEDNQMAPAEADINPPDAPDSNPELVTSVRVALAEWEAEKPAVDVQINETVAVRKVAASKTITKAQEGDDKVAPATAPVPPAPRAKTITDNAVQAQYDLVFLNVPEPGTAYEMKSTQQIQLFNITYLNPLLIRYKGRHFLRSAGIWYELSIPSTGKQPLIPLKDKALLNEFGSE
ncbi:MAG: hypothetical protein KJS92_09755 [Bacteroidetes bacterium]|nr:hypothetical protein [Bacteroidota bacterium]